MWLLGAIGTGVISAVVTGWPLLLGLVPLVLIAVPALLTAPPQPEIEILAGLDRWVRLVSTSLTAGKSIRDAIFATRAQAPPCCGLRWTGSAPGSTSDGRRATPCSPWPTS